MFKFRQILLTLLIIGYISAERSGYKKRWNRKDDDLNDSNFYSDYHSERLSHKSDDKEEDNYHSSHSRYTPAAIKTKRYLKVIPFHSPKEELKPHVVEVEASRQPFHFIFKTMSSPIAIEQVHTPAKSEPVESTYSEDEAHRLKHEVFRPVIQEVREIIQPYRKFRQEIRPLMEEAHTIVSENSRQRNENRKTSSKSRDNNNNNNKYEVMHRSSTTEKSLDADYSKRKGLYKPEADLSNKKDSNELKQYKPLTEIKDLKVTDYKSVLEDTLKQIKQTMQSMSMDSILDSTTNVRTEPKLKKVPLYHDYTLEDLQTKTGYSMEKTKESSFERDEEKPKELPRQEYTKQTTNSVTDLEQMDNIIPGDYLKMIIRDKSQIPSPPTIKTRDHREKTSEDIHPFLYLNSGKINIKRSGETNFYSEGQLSEDSSEDYPTSMDNYYL